jgi:RNA polymerase sigma factor (sigma-70 family)
MPTRADRLLPYVRRVAGGDAPDDAALLTRFLSDRDPAAFAALVARHGPMVLRVCRRVLGDRHDAEDAFQATFLVLARKAACVRPASALAAWLYGVACRVAQAARSTDARRRRREVAAVDLDPPDRRPDPLAELSAREALRMLDEEVQRLPQAYRLPVVLCALEGLSQEEAARQLGWTPGSVKGRLERGRKRLHQRLARRGLELAAAFALAEASRGLAAGPAGELAAATAKAAVAFAAGEVVGCCGVPAEVTSLAQQALRGMALVKAKVGLGAALLLGLLAVGVGLMPHPAPQAKPSGEAEARASLPAEPEGKPPPRTDRLGDPLPPGAVARVGSIRWWFGPTDDAFRLCPLAYTPDGKTLAASDAGTAIRFLDSATGKEIRRIEVPGHGFTSFAIAPDGRTMVTADSRSSVLWLWEVATGKELRQLTGDKDRVGIPAVAFSPDGKTLAAMAGTGIRLWDALTWEERPRLTERGAGGDHFLAFLPDGKRLISGNGAAIRWWDVSLRRVVRCLDKDFPPGKGFYELAVSPDGKRLAVLVQHNVLHLWDAATGNEVCRTALKPSRGGWCMCFSPDGQTLACGNGVGGRGSGTVFFSADTGRELRRWDDNGGHTTHMTYSPDGKVLAQAMSGVIRLRDATTGNLLGPAPEIPAGVLAVRFGRDGKALTASCLGGRTGSWDALTGEPLASVHGPPPDFDLGPRMDLFQRIAVTADGRKAALADATGAIQVWETATGKACCRIAEPPPCGEDGAVFSADTKVLAVAHRDSSLRLWDTTTGKLLRSFPQVKPRFLRPLVFSPDGRLLALYFLSTTAVSEAQVVRLWDTTTGEERAQFPWPEDTSPAEARFSADGQRFIVSYDPQWAQGAARERIGLCVWDVASGREQRRFRGPAGPIALSPDEKTLAAAGDNTIRLWELASGKERGQFTGHRERIRALAFSPNGRLLASGALDYTALVWDVTGVCPDGRWSSHDLPPAEIERLWAELGGTDGVRAYRAGWALAAARQTAAFLAERLRAVPPVERERLTRLIAELDSDRFAVRSRASKELEQLGELAEPAMRQALAGKPAPEVRSRLKMLLELVASRAPSAEQLRDLRAVEVLEHLGTPAARQVLTALSQGASGASLTREARASLQRLSRPQDGQP